jgi:hypothetical protein
MENAISITEALKKAIAAGEYNYTTYYVKNENIGLGESDVPGAIKAYGLFNPVELGIPEDARIIFTQCTIDFSRGGTQLYRPDFKNRSVAFHNCSFPNGIDLTTGRGDIEFGYCTSAGVVSIIDCVKTININNSEFYGLEIAKCHGLNLWFNEATKVENCVTISNCLMPRFYMSEQSRICYLNLNHGYVGLASISGTISEILRLHQIAIGEFHFGGTAYVKHLNASDCSVLTRVVNADAIKEHFTTKTVQMFPPEKNLVLYKKCLANIKNHDREVIVKLSVPDTAKRVYCRDSKIRVSEAKVEGMYYLDGKELEPEFTTGNKVYSIFNEEYFYNMGEVKTPTCAFTNMSGTCGSGIHGFVDFDSAVDYDY